MKKRIIQSLLAIVCCVTVALSAIPTAEAAMRASVVTGSHTVRGEKSAACPLSSRKGHRRTRRHYIAKAA